MRFSSSYPDLYHDLKNENEFENHWMLVVQWLEDMMDVNCLTLIFSFDLVVCFSSSFQRSHHTSGVDFHNYSRVTNSTYDDISTSYPLDQYQNLKSIIEKAKSIFPEPVKLDLTFFFENILLCFLKGTNDDVDIDDEDEPIIDDTDRLDDNDQTEHTPRPNSPNIDVDQTMQPVRKDLGP